MVTPRDSQLQNDSGLVKTKDVNGNPVVGVYRSPTGGLVVRNNSAYQRYMKEKEQQERLQSLEADVDEIKSMLKQLLEKM